MSITIRELASELSVSKESIRKHVVKLPADLVSHGQRGAIYISDEAADIIRQQVAANKTATTTNQTTTDNQGNTDNISAVCISELTTENQRLQAELQTANAKIQLLADNLADIRAELERKNTELEAKNKQISDLMQALQNEQILHGKMMQLEAPKQRKWYDVFRKRGTDKPT